MKHTFYLLPLVALVTLFSGCETLEKGVPQEVVIVSYPTQASVYINGEAVGITPITTELPRKLVHLIRLEKAGYNSANKYVAPVPNDKATQFIRFGLSQDLGYYADLEPRKTEAKLKSELVPSSTGADPFEKMTLRALEADRQLEAGKISPMEHKYIIEQIIEYFEKVS
jgi:hypothetical protein